MIDIKRGERIRRFSVWSCRQNLDAAAAFEVCHPKNRDEYVVVVRDHTKMNHRDVVVAFGVRYPKKRRFDKFVLFVREISTLILWRYANVLLAAVCSCIDVATRIWRDGFEPAATADA